MKNQHFLVTGALGCIGAWVVRNLVDEGTAVTVFDLGTNPARLALIMDDGALARVNFVQGDITDGAQISATISEEGITHIIHLAALQVPFCRAEPAKGAAVNVVGTVNIFQAAKAAGLAQVTYASSIAVYGPKSHYDTPILPHDAPLYPLTHYGVYKQANEGTARIFWHDEGIASIGLRPYTLYGPGRDQGMTSAPTAAMLAAAQGEAFHIPYGGVGSFNYADDVAKIFIQAARTPHDGASVFNLGGAVASMQEVVDAIHAVAPDAAITFTDTELPFPQGFDDSQLRATLGPIPDTSLQTGVAQTVAHFQTALANGRLKEKRA